MEAEKKGAEGGQGRCRIDTFNRSLSLNIDFDGCTYSYGSLMLARLLDAPTLTVTAVGARTITPTADGGPISVLFPVNTNPNQNVSVAGTGFVGEVAIKVVLIPESGARTEFAGTLSEGTASVPVSFPVNVITEVLVMTGGGTN